MTTRCTLLRAAAFMLVVLAFWGMPAGLRAQDKCACDHYVVTVDPALTCKVNFCYQLSPKGPTICETFGPGDKFKIPCPVYEAGITLCDGTLLTVLPANPAGARCTDIVHITRDCCARVCYTVDESGCPGLSIVAQPCLNDVCP